jgi:heme exporter protein D
MQDFFAMGGYGFYVWGSVGVTALLMIIEPLLLFRRRQHLLQRLSRSRDRGRRRSRQKQETMILETEKVKHETQT